MNFRSTIDRVYYASYECVFLNKTLLYIAIYIKNIYIFYKSSEVYSIKYYIVYIQTSSHQIVNLHVHVTCFVEQEVSGGRPNIFPGEFVDFVVVKLVPEFVHRRLAERRVMSPVHSAVMVGDAIQIKIFVSEK